MASAEPKDDEAGGSHGLSWSCMRAAAGQGPTYVSRPLSHVAHPLHTSSAGQNEAAPLKLSRLAS